MLFAMELSIASSASSLPGAAMPPPDGNLCKLFSRGALSDASLDAQRTSYLKSQLRFAEHLLDDAVAGLRHAAIDKLGGPAHAEEPTS